MERWTESCRIRGDDKIDLKATVLSRPATDA
jgi:hypothetical protein